MTGARGVGERVEELLASLSSDVSRAAAEELVRLLIGLYGDGLARIMAVLADHGEAGLALTAAIAEDPLVESLLLLHDLHPLDVDARVQRALDRVRPYLGSHAGGVEYLGVTDGVARLRLEGSCNGCPSSVVTVQLAIEGAVLDAAPEVTEVVVEGMTESPAPALLQIGPRPPSAAGPAGTAAGAAGTNPRAAETDPRAAETDARAAGTNARAAGADARSVPASPDPATAGGVGWITLPNLGPPSSRPVIAAAGGVTVLLCSVRGTLYAYRDSCAACGSSLAQGLLEREQLTCPDCAARYNVRLAGQGIDDPELHLHPLPLLADSRGVQVALPEVARA
jgi:Fe-S cluster biogenesis protein NfuA/nitrite reductase/ring-hydroxylating ferredoxin subunit